MKTRSVLIVGSGDLGERVGTQLMSAGYSGSALRRSPEKLPRGIVQHGGRQKAIDLIQARKHVGQAVVAPGSTYGVTLRIMN